MKEVYSGRKVRKEEERKEEERKEEERKGEEADEGQEWVEGKDAGGWKSGWPLEDKIGP